MDLKERVRTFLTERVYCRVADDGRPAVPDLRDRAFASEWLAEATDGLIAMIGEEKDKELAAMKADIESNRKARLDAEIRATKAASECDRLEKQLAEAKEYIESLEEQLAEATKPGRVLSDGEIMRKLEELFNRSSSVYSRQDRIDLVRWAIAESKPWLCGPSAEDVWNKAMSLQYPLSRFTEWFNVHFKPAAEYEKRIAELVAECNDRRDNAVADTEARQQLHDKITELQAKLDKQVAHSRRLEAKIGEKSRKINELQAEVERLKTSEREYRRNAINAQEACMDEAAEKQQLQDETKRLQETFTDGFLSQITRLAATVGLDWDSSMPYDEFVERAIVEVERLKQQQLPPGKCIANRLSREQAFEIGGKAINVDPSSMMGTRSARLVDDLLSAIVGDEVDLKPIDAAIKRLKRLLAEKGEVKTERRSARCAVGRSRRGVGVRDV